MMFLKSLNPYLKNMDILQKLQVRNEIQTILINQLSIKNQQHQNSNVPPAPIHELYISQRIQQQITTNSSDNPTFIDYQQYWVTTTSKLKKRKHFKTKENLLLRTSILFSKYKGCYLFFITTFF